MKEKKTQKYLHDLISALASFVSPSGVAHSSKLRFDVMIMEPFLSLVERMYQRA